MLEPQEDQEESRPPVVGDLSEFPTVPRKQTIAVVPSGEVRIETGADGAYLLFDCDCMDALPYCKAQCCALLGTTVGFDELAQVDYDAHFDGDLGAAVLKRDADGFCTYLDREKRCCSIYEDRPRTCQAFHCSRGPLARGWKLANAVSRQSIS